jgi:hypothetical protein
MAIATLEVFRMRYRAFCDRFGRDPEPDEPLFFDPMQEAPVAPDSAVIRSQVLAAASAAKVDGRLVLDFMRLSRRNRPVESGSVAQSWRSPEDRSGRQELGVPEEPSSSK